MAKAPRDDARPSYRSKERLATYATQQIELRAEDFVDAVRGESHVTWSIDNGARHDGATHKMMFRTPGTHKITAYLGGRSFSKDIVVGVDPAHLIRNPDLYDEFFYCIVTVLNQKVYFLPIRPLTQAANPTAAHRPKIIQEAALDEPAYRDFVKRQDKLYACDVLQRSYVDPSRFQDGVYAVFESGMLWLGSTPGLDAGLGSLRSFLDFDAQQTNFDLARPDRVFDQINTIADAFDPTSLIGSTSNFLFPGLGTDPDSAWVSRNIGKGFSAFEDHLGSIGLNPKGGDRLGCMFGFNTRDATFSSRFSSPELGVSRQSTNMLDFSGGRAGGMAPPISRGQMLGDSSMAYGVEPNTYWDGNLNARVVGASSQQELAVKLGQGYSVFGYWDDTDQTVVMQLAEPVPGDVTPAGTGDSGGSGGSASPGTASAGTASPGTASAGTASAGTASAGTASAGTASPGTASGGGGASGASGTSGSATGEPQMPVQDDSGVGPAPYPIFGPRLPVSQFGVRQRGTGYTDPDSGYGGTGSGPYRSLLGFVCPFQDEWGPLIYPTRDDGYTATIGVGMPGASSTTGRGGTHGLPGFGPPIDFEGGGGAGVSGPLSEGMGGLGVGMGGYVSYDDVCPTAPRRVEPIDPAIVQQMVMEKVQGRLTGLNGVNVNADGLFAMGRTYNCSGFSARPAKEVGRFGTIVRGSREEILRMIGTALASTGG